MRFCALGFAGAIWATLMVGASASVIVDETPLSIDSDATSEQQPAAEQPVLSAANGDSYQIVSLTTTYFPDAQCGFNDLSLPNMAQYSTESRHWTSHSNGQVIREWDETVTTFVACLDGP